MARATRYTQEHLDWLLNNYRFYNSYNQIAENFNKNFQVEKSVSAIQQTLTKKLKVQVSTPKKSHHYTEEEEEWLLNNHSLYSSFQEIADKYNQIFTRNKSATAISDKLNKGFGLNLGKNITSYKEGNIKQQLPIGTIRKVNGYSYIKTKDSQFAYQSGYSEPYWTPLQKKIWQDHYGEIAEDEMVVFLDKNKENFDLNNLCCINRRISVRLAQNGWYSENANVTLAGIKWCEHFYGIRDSYI